jgi:Ca-activated chloride channel family protein
MDRRARRAKGTFLTVLGFGTGNLQDTKMEQMAQHGNGNYAYIDSLLEARKVLVTEMGGTLVTVASDVKLQVEFNPARVASYRLIGYENRLLAPEDFNDDQRDAGELGAGHVVTALYEIVPVGIESEVQPGRVDPLRYQQPASVTPAPLASEEIAFVRVRYKQPGRNRSLLLEQPVTGRMGRRTADFDFATAVAGFGMLLRNSEHRGSIDVRQILALATAGRGSDEHGHRAEFVRLVELYRGIASADRHGGDDR